MHVVRRFACVAAISVSFATTLALGCVVRTGSRHDLRNEVGAPDTNGRPFDEWFAENVQVGMPRDRVEKALLGKGLICWYPDDDTVECSFVDDGPPSRYRRIELVIRDGKLAKIVHDDGESATDVPTE